MTHSRTRHLVSSWLIALLAIALLPFISAPKAEAAPNNKATICHRTKSITNPYRLITVSRNSISGNNGHAGHKTNPTSGIWTTSKVQGDNWEDIIPGDLNWSTSGAQDIYYGRTRTAAGIPVCRSMTFSQFYKSEKDAGRTDAQIAADLDDGMSDEDKAVLKTFGGSSCTTFAGCSTSLSTISTNSKTIAAVTTFATNVTSSSATLNGYVKADSNSIRYYFEYSTDGTWATEPTKVPSTSAGPVTSDTTTAVTYNLTGLNDGTTYYYRIVAEYTPSGGTLQEVSGDLVSFQATNTQKYVIKYESNGGTDGLAPVDTKLYPANSAAKVLANYGNLTKNGRAFTGWSLSPGAGLIAGPISLAESLKIISKNKSGIYSPLARISFLRVAPPPQYTSGTYSGGSDITVQSSDITLYAQYETAYTVTYSLNGGSGTLPTETDKASGATFSLASSTGLSKDGYTFAGWNDGSTTYSAGATYTMPASNVTLTAQWTANTLTVTYDSQGGSSISSGSTTTGGSISTSPGTPTRSGYTFNGWFVASTGGTAITFSYAHGQTSNFTLYAQWTPDTYTVTYNGNSNDGGSAPANQTKTHDVSLTLATNSGSLTRSGYTLNGWNTEANGSGTSYATGASYTTNAGLTLYAKWTLIGQYTVTYSLNGGSGTLPTETDKASGATFSLASSTGLSKDGYTFAGWNDGSTTYSAGATYTMPASNVTLTAQWTANTLTVTYDSQGGSSISSGSTTTGGSISTSPGTPTRSGYTFNGWFVASTGGTAITFSYAHGQTSNFTLYAQWTPDTYTVTYNGNSNDGGSAPANQTKTHDVSLTLATNSGSLTRSGYTLNGWNTEANGSGTSYATGASYTTNAGLTLYAKWTTVSSGGNSEPITPPPPPPGPIISSLSASDLCAISSDLTIYGSNFGDAKVTFDGTQVNIKTSSASTIVVTLPTSSLGKKTLIVTTPNGTATAYVNYLTASKPKFQPIRIPYLAQGSLLSLDLLADDALRFRLSGSLPSGVSFNETTGLLSGTPTENGVFVLNVVAIGVCGETTSVLELDVDAPTPNAMSHRINFLPGSCELSDSAKASFEEFITKIKGLSPRNIIPDIYISGGSKNSDPNSPIAQCRQDSLCDLLLIEDLTGDVLTDVFTGSENRIEIIVYWPRPNDDL